MTPTIRRILLYACLVAALMGYAFVEGRNAQATDQAVSFGNAVLGGHAGFRKLLERDSLRVLALRRSEGTLEALEGHWRHTADSLLADTLDTTGAVQTPNFPAVTASLGKALSACDASRETSDSARTVLASDLAAGRMRSDTLEAALGRLLKVRAPRWGFTVGPALLASPNGTAHAGFAVVWGYRF